MTARDIEMIVDADVEHNLYFLLYIIVDSQVFCLQLDILYDFSLLISKWMKSTKRTLLNCLLEQGGYKGILLRFLKSIPFLCL